MKIKLTLSSLALLAIAPSAFAQYSSPELLLVVDNGNGTAAHQSKIDRYDTASGQYLGSFGQDHLNSPNSYVSGVNVVGQEAYVTDVFVFGTIAFSRIQKFNFSTGVFDGSIYDASPYRLNAVNSFGAHTLALDAYTTSFQNSTLWSYDAAGHTSIVSTFNTSLNGFASSFVDGTALIAAGNGIYLEKLNPDSTANGAPILLAGTTGSFDAVTSTLNGVTTYFDTPSFSTALIEKRSVTTGALLASYGPPSPAYSYDWLASGHNGSIFAERNPQTLNGGAFVDIFTGDNGLSLGPEGSIKLTATYDAGKISVYAAPEPQPIMLVGIGLAGLLIKRRRAR